jgi:predicted transcriptional regulator
MTDRVPQRLTVRVDPYELGQLDALAKLKQVSRSELVRAAIEWYAKKE